jgi:hypothetical protein
MPAEPDDADELIEAYDQVILELEGGGSTCPKCGGSLGATTTMNTDGRSYHPECVRAVGKNKISPATDAFCMAE